MNVAIGTQVLNDLRQEEWEQLQQKQAEKLLKDLAAVLAAGNLDSVCVEYSGSGDSGQFEVGSFRVGEEEFNAEGVLTELQRQVVTSLPGTRWSEGGWETYEEQVSITLEQWFIEAAHSIVAIRYEGWENDEGGRGDVVFKKDGVLCHHVFYVEEHYRHTYPVGVK